MESLIKLMPSGQEVPCAAGDTVLGALERAGYALPNNCRAGACGECKIRVVEGEFNQGMVLDMALSPEERRSGFGLMCMAKPLSPVLAIAWGGQDARPKLFPPRENQRYVVVDRVPRTPRIVELRLRPLAAPMRFWPGQYVRLGDPQRHYSIANAPQPDGTLVLWVTRVEDGQTSRWLHDQVAPGDVLTLDGPYGTFIGDPTTEAPILCLAAGSGLAPIRALTEAALRRGFQQPVTLFFSARTREDLFDLGMLRYWTQKHRRFNFRPTLTREEAPGMLHGRIPDLLPGLFPDLSRHGIFIAGAPVFVDACVAAVAALGARPEQIHVESFTPATKTPASAN
jgi:CDP-4-dehydro-6-deoxyglucose reductase